MLYRGVEPVRSIPKSPSHSLRSQDIMSQRSIAGTLFSWLAIVSYGSCKEESRLIPDIARVGSTPDCRNVSILCACAHHNVPRAAETIGLLLVSLGSKAIVMSWIANVFRGVNSAKNRFFNLWIVSLRVMTNLESAR